jgi:hypothetical protein
MALDGYLGNPRANAQPSKNDKQDTFLFLAADWGERAVTTVAVSAAVLVVALIAVLMGSVGP